MAIPRRRVLASFVLPLGMLALLALLAWLQYRWTGEVSRAEAERMEAGLRVSVRRFGDEVDEEVARVFEAFHVTGEDELREAYAAWWSEEPHPEIVGRVYLAHEGMLLEIRDDGLVEVDWPEGLDRLRPSRADLRAGPRTGERRPPFPAISGAPPAMLIPMGPMGPTRARWRRSSDRVLVELSLDALRADAIPELASRFFATAGGFDYDVVILDEAGEPVWTSDGADVSRVVAQPDAASRLFSLAKILTRFAPRPEPPPGPEPPRGPEPIRELARDLFEGHWQLFARHRAGSLDAAVGRVRRRNLAVSFGILALLGGSVGLVVVSARRAVELGNRKMEFVAGVSHELRTPLAVIRSAAQNLADGSVSDPSQIARYGNLVEGQGRRLEALVEEVLELAGIESQTRRYRRERVDLASLAEAVVEESDSLAGEKHVELVGRFPEAEVLVLGDDAALRRALSNLIVNAIKHGGEANRVEVALETRGDEVAIEVSDRGPGIHEDDLPHLFEPFYRGRRARDRQVSGSGLGLSLVEHVVREHGGRVEVSSRLGEGSRFTVWLPLEHKT